MLPDPAKQPPSVRLPILAGSVDLGVLLAALLISTIAPIVLFCSCNACSCAEPDWAAR